MEATESSRLPWSAAADDLVRYWKTSPEKGLEEKEAHALLGKYGPNKIEEFRAKSVWRILAEQFNSIIVLCLAIAAGIAFAFGDWKEGFAIVLVILLNGATGFFTEWRAVRSMEALRKLSQIKVKVRRSGKISEIAAEDLVPGDVMVVEGGDIVGADARLLKMSNLQVDESSLTGESIPVSKTIEPVSRDAVLADRTDMLFRGTSVTRGSGEGLVVETGMRTELGKIAADVQQAHEEVTPLQKRLDHLGRRLVWLTLGIMVLIAISGILAGRDIVLMIKTAIALAVAGIPEGLPIVATVALAKGMWRMSRRNALINRLSSVETLGATTVIFVDKTGTLTENQMSVTRLAFESGEIEVSGDSSTGGKLLQKGGKAVESKEVPELANALHVSVLCNTATLKKDPTEGAPHIGDPMEVALLVLGAKAGIERDALLKTTPEVRQESFDPNLKMMATIHGKSDKYFVAVKGASEAVIPCCSRRLTSQGTEPMEDRHREIWLKQNHEMAAKGLRILALAEKYGTSPEINPYEGLTFIGLIGLLDPPRKDVRDAIRLCQKAGIRVVMVTGDQAPTARAVGEAVGISSNGQDLVTEGKALKDLEKPSPEVAERINKTTIFARVEPKQKLDLISFYQKQKQVVAMTGDGVNDAPALKKADIGIAMGQRGTEVAREASDMILKDDAFTSIVAAVEEGRVIFGNIRKFVIYLLSCNISEILVVGLASLVYAPLPLLPLQILYLNLVTDVFPALALGVGGSTIGAMDLPPRDPREPVLTRQHWISIGGFGALLTISVLVGFTAALVWLKFEETQAVTVSFLSLGFAQLWHVFNMRESGSSFLRNEVTQNPFAWGAIALCTGLLLVAVFVPGLRSVLRLVPPTPTGWFVIATASLVPLIVGQAVRSFSSPIERRETKFSAESQLKD